MRHYEHAIRAIEDLRPFGKNPRHHPDSQITKLQATIKSVGFTNPLLIDDTNAVLAGYGRLMAARGLDMTEVPCIVVTGLTHAQKQTLMVADNRIPQESAWDTDLLIETLGEISFAGIDMTITGFDGHELDTMLAPMPLSVEPDESDASGEEKIKGSRIVVTVANPINLPSVAAILRKAIKASHIKGITLHEPRH